MEYNEYGEEEERRKPKRKKSKRKFNKKLDLKYINIPEDDTSFRAQLVRTMVTGVSYCVTPRQLISFIFILAAYTIVFLFTAIAADCTFIYYEYFYELSDEVIMKLGNAHDAKIRIFASVFALLGIMVELDTAFIAKNVAILRSFIPRSLLLFFVATLSDSNPMVVYEWQLSQIVTTDDQDDGTDDYDPNFFYRYSANYTSWSEEQNQGDDGIAIIDEIPAIVIQLQSISSTLLQISVWTYLFLGILCLDQLGPEAFVPNNNDRKIASNHLPREISQRSQNSANSNNIASDPSGRNFGRDGSNVRRNTSYV